MGEDDLSEAAALDDISGWWDEANDDWLLLLPTLAGLDCLP
jgi:hypothetical protein